MGRWEAWRLPSRLQRVCRTRIRSYAPCEQALGLVPSESTIVSLHAQLAAQEHRLEVSRKLLYILMGHRFDAEQFRV